MFMFLCISLRTRRHARMVAKHETLISAVDEAYAVVPTTSIEVDPPTVQEKLNHHRDMFQALHI